MRQGFWKKRMIRLAMICMICFGITQLSGVTAEAVTCTSVGNGNVYLKQSGSGTCTLCASTMMLRRAAVFDGNTQWKKMTEAAVRKSAWLEGAGLRWSFSYAGMQVQHGELPGGSANKKQVINLLEQHPEGIVLYDRTVPHAVLLTDYTNGTFYCSDPATGIAKGRIALNRSYRVQLEKATAYWYIQRRTFTVGALKYQALDTPGHQNEAQVVGVTSQCGKTVKIPDRVSGLGRTYKVTRIGEKAFSGCENIKTIRLNNNLTTIGSKAFYGAGQLTKIQMYGKKVKGIGKNAFASIGEKAVFHVPTEQRDSYSMMLWNSGIGGLARVTE